jgi:putative acetyltransferase
VHCARWTRGLPQRLRDEAAVRAPAFRGFGLGRLLAEASWMPRAVGYASVLLDTLTTWRQPGHCMRDLGFEEIPPYYHNPIPGAHYLKADL